MTNLKDLEKRVEQLEKELAMLKSKSETTVHHSNTRKHKKKENKKEKKKGKTKRKVNKFFQDMLKAKREGKPSFKYNGELYKGTKHPKLGMVYKRA